MFIYSIFYYHTRLNIIGFVSKLLYFGYSLLMSLVRVHLLPPRGSNGSSCR